MHAAPLYIAARMRNRQASCSCGRLLLPGFLFLIYSTSVHVERDRAGARNFHSPRRRPHRSRASRSPTANPVPSPADLLCLLALRLRDRVVRGEFMDLSELLPTSLSLSLSHTPTRTVRHNTAPTRRARLEHRATCCDDTTSCAAHDLRLLSAHGGRLDCVPVHHSSAPPWSCPRAVRLPAPHPQRSPTVSDREHAQWHSFWKLLHRWRTPRSLEPSQHNVMVHKNASTCLPVVPTVHKHAQCGPPHNAPHFLKLFALSCKHHARSRARRSLPSLPQLQLRGHPCFLHPSRPHHSCRNCGGHGHGAHQCKRKEPPNHCILTLILATPSDYALCDQRTTLPVVYLCQQYYYDLASPLASAKTPSFSSEWICPEEFCICDIIQLLNNFLTAGPLASDIRSSACPYLGIFGRKETVASPTPLMSVCAHHPTYLTRSQKFSSGSAETSSPYMISYICWMTTSRLAHQHHQSASNAWTSSLPPATTPGCP